MAPYTLAFVGAALFGLASTTSSQGIAAITKKGGLLHMDAPDVQFKLASGSDTVSGFAGEIDDAVSTFTESLNTFKADTSKTLDEVVQKNNQAIDALKTASNAKAKETEDRLQDGLKLKRTALASKKSAFQTKYDALKKSIAAKLEEFKRLSDGFESQVGPITAALNKEKTTAKDATDSFKNGINSEVKKVDSQLGDKRTATKYIWIGGPTRSGRNGWGYLPLNRVDLDAKGDYFSVSGDTFTVRKPGLYRLNYQGRTKGRGANNYAIVYLNGRSITAHYYNKHVGWGWTYNPSNVDISWKFRQGDKIRFRLYEPYGGSQGWIGTRQGSLASESRISFEYVAYTSQSMQVNP